MTTTLTTCLQLQSHRLSDSLFITSTTNDTQRHSQKRLCILRHTYIQYCSHDLAHGTALSFFLHSGTLKLGKTPAENCFLNVAIMLPRPKEAHGGNFSPAECPHTSSSALLANPTTNPSQEGKDFYASTAKRHPWDNGRITCWIAQPVSRKCALTSSTSFSRIYKCPNSKLAAVSIRVREIILFNNPASQSSST